MYSRTVFILGLVFLVVSACTAVPNPTPTPDNTLAEVATIERIRPSVTPTSIPPTATATGNLETATALTPTSTNIPESTPIPTKIPFQFSERIEDITTFDNIRSLVWSPTENAFVSYSCPRGEGVAVDFVRFPDIVPVALTPTELNCYVNIIWHPTGTYFYFSAETTDLEEWGSIFTWKVDNETLSLSERERGSYYWGWLSDDLRISQRRIGTGIFSITIFNVTSKKGVSGSSFDGAIAGKSKNYVLLQTEPHEGTSVAVLAQESISPEFAGWLHGTDVKFLSWKYDLEDGLIYYDPSLFMDVVPSKDQALVVTFAPINTENRTLMSGENPANLQLWDIDSDELSILVSGGIYGRFSPDGSHLAYLIPKSGMSYLELLKSDSNDILFSQPAYAEEDYKLEVTAFTSFSSDGRFLTFYSPTPELMLYDLEAGEFLAPLTAVPFTPLWSPDSSRFVYDDPDKGLSIFDVRS